MMPHLMALYSFHFTQLHCDSSAKNFIAAERELTLLFSISDFNDLYSTCNQTESWAVCGVFDGDS